MDFLSRTARLWVGLELVAVIPFFLAFGNLDNPAWLRIGALALWGALMVVQLVAVAQRENRRNEDGAYWVKILLIAGPFGWLAWLRHDDRSPEPHRPAAAEG